MKSTQISNEKPKLSARNASGDTNHIRTVTYTVEVEIIKRIASNYSEVAQLTTALAKRLSKPKHNKYL